jgi:hypothetical protein
MVAVMMLALLALAANALAPAAPALVSPWASDQPPSTEMVEDAVKATLKDPDSARFTWPYGFVQGTYQTEFNGKYPGSITCGTVNAKNGYGGYSGDYAVAVVMDGSSVVKTEMDGPGPWNPHISWVAEECRKLGLDVL